MKILIVDDEKLARLAIRSQLDERFEVIEASNFNEAIDKLDTNLFEICFIDLKLDTSNELKGLDLIPLATRKGIYTVVMTSIEDDLIAEKAYEKGCQDLYNKGNEKNHISETISRYFLSKDSFTEGYFFKDIVPTKSIKYKEDLKKLLKIIPTDLGICLLGETGTGKTYLAKSIHEISKRPGKFVAINCATFSGETLKNELFGHKKGAFTGADSDTIGKLELANGGTIFLDEIGSMSLEMQEQLLKVSEEQSYYPVGSNKLVKINVRILSATCENLQALVKSKKFRLDLYHRLAGYTFTQPPLRNRKEDISNILKNALKSSRKIIIKDDLQTQILNYTWPGNIRELLRFAEVISASNSGILKEEDFLDFIENSCEKVKISNVEDHHYDRIKEIGIRNFLDEYTVMIMKRALAENDGVSTQAIAELKTSNGFFYKYLDKETSPDTSPMKLKLKLENEYEIH